MEGKKKKGKKGINQEENETNKKKQKEKEVDKKNGKEKKGNREEKLP